MSGTSPFEYIVSVKAFDGDGKEGRSVTMRGVTAYSPVTALKQALNEIEDQGQEEDGLDTRFYTDMHAASKLVLEVEYDPNQNEY